MSADAFSRDPAEARPLRLAILQRICAGYRLDLFSRIASTPGVEARLFFGADIPDSKVKGVPEAKGIDGRKLKTRFLRLGRRVLPWHAGLLAELRRFSPDVILCEGESHFLGYLQAIVYRALFNRRTALMHWCFIDLPGKPHRRIRAGHLIKGWFRRFFDAFVLYSTFSKECLVRLGVDPGKAFVATNVGDVGRFLAMADSVPETPAAARAKLGLPERFTVLYVGTLDGVKRPGVMLDLAASLPREEFNFVLLGGGPLLEDLKARESREGLENVRLPGRITGELPLYYRAGDVLLIPGRGGIVISEAMAFGLPVIVHEADGTEFDLVLDRETGVRLQGSDVADFRRALEELKADRALCAAMGRTSRHLVESRFTTANMASQILKAARFAARSRAGKAPSAFPEAALAAKAG